MALGALVWLWVKGWAWFALADVMVCRPYIANIY